MEGKNLIGANGLQAGGGDLSGYVSLDSPRAYPPLSCGGCFCIEKGPPLGLTRDPEIAWVEGKHAGGQLQTPHPTSTAQQHAQNPPLARCLGKAPLPAQGGRGCKGTCIVCPEWGSASEAGRMLRGPAGVWKGREGGSDARSRMARTRGRAWIGTGWLLEVKGGWGHEATCTSWLSEAAVNTADAWTEKTWCRHTAEGHSAVTGGPAICAHVDGAGGQHAE